MTTRKGPIRPAGAVEREGMQLVSRAASVLRALEGQAAGLSLGQIAAATGLPRPTVQRIVDALLVELLVAPDHQNGGVRLGPAIARMARWVSTDLVALARPHLERLSWAVHETTAMTVLQDGRVILVALASAVQREISLTSQIGAVWTLHSTSEGKAMLAGLPEETIRGLLPEPLVQRTAKTTTSVDALIGELAEVERSGFALDVEGTREGIASIATRITDASGLRYAISILTPASRFGAGLARFREALGQCRAAITREAGLG